MTVELPVGGCHGGPMLTNVMRVAKEMGDDVQRWWTLAIVAAVDRRTSSDERPELASGAQRPAFRGGVDVVALNVTVTDGSRRYVTDLERTGLSDLRGWPPAGT